MSRVIVMLLLLVGVAHADDKALAEKYFRAGAKAYSAQNFQAAASNFNEAFKVLAMPEIAFSAAQAYRKLYQVEPKPEYVRRSVELYQFYLERVKTGGRVGDAADNLAEMKRELDKLEAAGVKTAPLVEKAQTRLVVNVSVADQSNDAALREIGDVSGDSAIKGLVTMIDGTKVDAFTPVVVEAKEHVVHVEADGYFPIDKRTVAVDGQSALVDIELKPKPAKLSVKTEDGARIFVDGRLAATPADVTKGKHLIAVLRRGREPFAREIDVTRGQEIAIDAPLAKTKQRKAVPWVLGGAGIAAVGAITTAVFASSRDGRAEDLQADIMMGNQPASVADERDAAIRSRDRFMTWTYVLGGAALVAGGTGVALLYFDMPTAESASAGVRGTF
jgi:hypothetical protein